MKKLTFLATLILLIIALAVPVFAADAQAKPFQDFTLVYNGEVQTFEASNPPLNLNGRTMLPLVYMFDLVNADGTGSVDWDGETKMVTFEYKDTTVKLWINNPNAEVNGEVVSVGGASPVIYNGRTYVPMSFVAGNFDLTVEWDGDTRTASVIQNDMLKEITDLIDKSNEGFDGKVTLTMDVDADTTVEMNGQSQETCQIAEMKAEIDLTDKYIHMAVKGTANDVKQEYEVYDDGEFMYNVVADQIIKMPSTLSLISQLENLTGTEYTEKDYVGLGLKEDKDGNYVIAGKLPIPLDATQSVTNEVLSELDESGVQYEISFISPAEVVYVIDKASRALISMDMSYSMGLAMTMNGEKVNMEMSCVTKMKDINLKATFETKVPDDIKKNAKTVEDLQK